MAQPVGEKGRKEGGKVRTGDVPGIVVTDGGAGIRSDLQPPRVRAFIYGEHVPPSPTLPFGRWRQAS